MTLYQTKTFWVGLSIILGAIGAYFMGEATLMETGVAVAAAAFGITGRDAYRKGK